MIKVLPTIVIFIDGIALDRVVGFEELGAVDDFATMTLTRRLIRSGALKALNKAEEGRVNLKKGRRKENDEDDDDDYDY